ncbi:MAG: TonB family protein [Bacteroidetes bacterium]|nr:MAG: TonB family protein [Bacteroidota bacterium]
MDPTVYTDDKRFLDLLERWLRGDFTRSDEQELYALLDKDAFRREAWEGFTALPEHEHNLHLERLRRRLLGERPGGRIPIGMWMAAAAAFVLLVVAVYFIPRPGQQSTASEPAAAYPQAERSVAPPDTGAEDAFADETPAPPPPQALSQKKLQPFRSRTGSGKGMANRRQEEADIAYMEEAEAPVQADNFPGPFIPDTLTPGFRQPEGKKDSPPVLVGGPQDHLQNMASHPIDGVAIGPAKARPKSSTGVAPAKPTVMDDSSRMPVITEPQAIPQARTRQAESATPVPEPDGGWDAFHTFVRRNARLTDAARNNNVSGNVRLQFTVGPDGKPANVQVVQALGYGCDEAAMQLIRLFNWQPPGTTPVVVEIPFVR